MAHRRFKTFHLAEISAVDRPAQKGALMSIMKRDGTGGSAGPYLAKRDGESPLPALVETYLKRDFSDDKRKELAASGAALPDGSYPIENRVDLRNAVRAFGRAKNKPKAKAHIVSRARALGATSSLPETWKSANFDFCAHLSNDEIVQGFDKAISIFKSEQESGAFTGEQADAVRREYANSLMEEVGKSVSSLRSVADEIADDSAIIDKSEALQESFDQFKGHLKGIVPDGIENGLVGAALHEAGYTVNAHGALDKRETEMGFDIRKSLGLPATATDAEVQKALDEKLAAFGKAETTNKTLANILKMSAGHCAYMNNDKAKMPEGGKEGFANMSAAERDSHIKANPLRETKAEKAARKKAEVDEDEDEADDDEDTEKCLKVDGTVIRKSVVGDGVFAVLKSQQEAINKAADERATAVFAKRAETSMPLIGKADELGGLIQSIAKLGGGDKIAEAVAKKFEQMNEVLKKGGKALFEEVGKANSGGGSFSKAKDQIEVLAKQMVAEGKTKSVFKARDMVRQSNPDLRKQEQDELAEEQAANKRRAA